ncbi:MAG: AMP-binding protein [Spongiibacteraceae bacterium]
MNTLFSITLDAVLDEHARSYPDHIAIADGDTHLTYPQLRARVDQLANALAQADVGSGDRVLWLGQNSFRVLELMLACARIGAMVCPANWRSSAAELAFVVDDLEPKIVFWQMEEVGGVIADARAQTAFREAQWLQHDCIAADGYEAFIAGGAAVPRPASTDAELAVLMIYTAAFGGRPNAAMLSHRALICQNQTMALVTGFNHRSAYLVSGPLFHIGTFKFMSACFHSAGKNVFVRRTDPQTLCEAISGERCTNAFLVTKTMLEMAELNSDGRYDLRSLQSEPVAPDWDNMVTLLPKVDYQRGMGYGQTEVCGFVMWQYFGAGNSVGRYGRPSPFVQVQIIDEAGNELPVGEVGEIAVRGPLVMNGYWRRPELNAQRQRGGWHRCNDLGRREIDGSFTFIGPKVQMIKSGVENIYPAEVENCLRSHPAVADCGVIGIPDPKWVQSIKAIVVLQPGVSANPQEIIEHCRDRIASYKKPRFVEFAEALPKNSIGFTDYKALDAAYGGGNYPGGFTPSK